jgi:hypothetical protein
MSPSAQTPNKTGWTGRSSVALAVGVSVGILVLLIVALFIIIVSRRHKETDIDSHCWETETEGVGMFDEKGETEEFVTGTKRVDPEAARAFAGFSDLFRSSMNEAIDCE